MERTYPLRALVCEGCYLVQLEAFEAPESIFSEYPYFSSYSSTWLEHARAYVEEMVPRLGLDENSRVVEVASNDGYLLQYFDELHIPVLGIEPAGNVAEAAIQRGIPTLVKFFGRETALELQDTWRADLLLGNNVLAHVPDLNDFIEGMKLLLKEGGVLTFEFPHLQQLVDQNQFDTIYHEHFSYFSLLTVQRVFASHGLRIFDVQELPTHGGSLRIFGCHDEDESKAVTDSVTELAAREREAGYEDMSLYEQFAAGIHRSKREILQLLIGLKEEGKTIVGYGAPAKGNTLLNYCGIGTDFLDYTVDISPHKQGCYLPGTRIPILPPEALRETRPDVVVVLPWNLKDEIIGQHSYVSEWGGRFAVLSPSIQVLD
jgi:SAM-dependent methyltransferase